MTPPRALQRMPVGATKGPMSRNRGIGACAAFLSAWAIMLAILLAGVSAARAEGVLEISTLRSSQDLAPYIRTLTTKQKQIVVEMPPGPDGKVDNLNLESQADAELYQWKIVALSNSGNAPRSLVLVVDSQGFAGSGIIVPEMPGSVVLSAAQTGGAQVSTLQALSHDAFSIDIEPASTAAFAFEVSSDRTAVSLWDREAYDLMSAFDFQSPPRKPVLLDRTREVAAIRTPRTTVIYGSYGMALSVAAVLVGVAYRTAPAVRRRWLRALGNPA